ncbi:MAG: 30S ribosomal protein S8 [Fusobacteriota bacterium]
MNVTDPIADMLTRLRNGNAEKHKKVDIPFSNEKEGLAKLLKEEGYILNYKALKKGNKKDLRVYLKYTRDDKRVLKGIKRISKPGRRVYTGVDEMPRVLGGLGVAAISTSKGILADRVCRKQNVGGEVLCYVW